MNVSEILAYLSGEKTKTKLTHIYKKKCVLFNKNGYLSEVVMTLIRAQFTIYNGIILQFGNLAQ